MWNGGVVANATKSLRDKIEISILWRQYRVASGGKRRTGWVVCCC